MFLIQGGGAKRMNLINRKPQLTSICQKLFIFRKTIIVPYKKFKMLNFAFKGKEVILK